MPGLHYKHTQVGYVLIGSLGVACIIFVFLALQTGFPPVSLFVVGILALCLFVFSSLTVTVTDTALEFWFSARLIRKHLPIHEIGDYQAVKNPWYYGWGIHAIPGGWVYNVSGFDAVEITLRNGKKYRIGTDEPEQLVGALRKVVEPT